MFTIVPELIKQQAAASPEGHQETMSFVDGYILACRDQRQALEEIRRLRPYDVHYRDGVDLAIESVEDREREARNLLYELKEV